MYLAAQINTGRRDIVPALRNAQRRIYKATYSPIHSDRTDEGNGHLARLTRFADKLAYLHALAVYPGEVKALNKSIREQDLPADTQEKALSVVGLLENGGTERGALSLRPDVASVLSRVDAGSLVALGRALVGVRKSQAESVLRAASEFVRDAPRGREDPPSPPPSEIMRRSREPRRSAVVESSSEAASALAARAPTTVDPRLAPDLESALAWAATSDGDRFANLRKAAESLMPVPIAFAKRSPVEEVLELAGKVLDWPAETETVVDAFVERLKIEPVGFLHLERLDFTPIGIERGELLYSLPLAPQETVRLTHKEWSLRSTEFEELVQDSLENYSEQGVTEKNDLTQSTESQSQHSRALSLSASYTYVSVSATIGFNMNDANSKAQRDSRNQSIEVTRKASSRARKEHKVAFKVTSAVGTEDEAVRVITNPRTLDSMRIDYYRLMRKWRVDLRRYGLRMTYDIVIPDPGADILTKMQELQALSETLDQPFSFPLPQTTITPQSWTSYAATYGANVTPPPDNPRWIYVHKELPPKSEDEAKSVAFDSIELDVSEDYEVEEAALEAWFSTDPDIPAPRFDVMWDAAGPSVGGSNHVSFLEYLTGKSGKLTIVFTNENIRHGAVLVRVKLKPKATTMERWRFAAWSAMREAAEERYHANRQVLSDRRDALKAELAVRDALTLRQIEREEIMKGALRWLFGPSFDFVPPDVLSLFVHGSPADPAASDKLDPKTLDAASWQRVLEFGEFIKFIHHAIEWENVLYFTYPYFWDSPRNWKLKSALEHPDPLHRNFLRAGSARVVLTVRPGFEDAFAAMMEQGAFGQLPTDHPYVTIAQEIQAYAATHYPDIPSPPPEEEGSEEAVADAERGELIGHWYEFTPTSAMDIAVDTPIKDLA
jgi:hypothetical protein